MALLTLMMFPKTMLMGSKSQKKLLMSVKTTSHLFRKTMLMFALLKRKLTSFQAQKLLLLKKMSLMVAQMKLLTQIQTIREVKKALRQFREAS